MSTSVADILAFASMGVLEITEGASIPIPATSPLSRRRTALRVQNSGQEIVLKLSNKRPDAPVEIESLQLFFEVVNTV